jgi:hypothetical protein
VVLNDALSIYYGDATLASAFVARWCAGSKIKTAGGVFRVREDEPQPVGATLDRTSRVVTRIPSDLKQSNPPSLYRTDQARNPPGNKIEKSRFS